MLMSGFHWLNLGVLGLALVVLGCGDRSNPTNLEAEVAALVKDVNLADMNDPGKKAALEAKFLVLQKKMETLPKDQQEKWLQTLKDKVRAQVDQDISDLGKK